VGKGKNYKGKDITLGGPGSGGMSRLALLTKYGWYTSKIQDEVKKQMRKRLDQEGGIPKGKLQAIVKIVLDPKGTVVTFQIVTSSGNNKMDEALKSSLANFRISQPPPDGMPATMTVRINSQG
jgi:TonB family protein